MPRMRILFTALLQFGILRNGGTSQHDFHEKRIPISSRIITNTQEKSKGSNDKETNKGRAVKRFYNDHLNFKWEERGRRITIDFRNTEFFRSVYFQSRERYYNFKFCIFLLAFMMNRICMYDV